MLSKIMIGFLLISILGNIFMSDLGPSDSNNQLSQQIDLKLTSITGAPILINNNSDLGVFSSSGNGTKVNPYIIQNYNIQGANSIGISVQNTNAFVIFTHNTVKKATKYGIYFNNVTNAIIETNTFSANAQSNIYFESSKENQILNNTIGLFNEFNGIGGYGIKFLRSSNNVVQNNTLTSTFYGLDLKYSHFNKIVNNNFEFTDLDLFLSDNNLISNNSLTGGEPSLFIYQGDNNSVSNNLVVGISVDNITNTTFSNNILSAGTFVIKGNILKNLLSNDLVNNTISGNDMLYIKNTNHLTITNLNLSSIILINCSYIHLNNINMLDYYSTINLFFSDYNIIDGLKIRGLHNNDLLFLQTSNYNNISNNELNDGMIGINFKSSNSNIIENNTINSNNNGIKFQSSHNNTIQGNRLNGGSTGIQLEYSNANIFTFNTIKFFGYYSFFIQFSNDNLIYFNIFDSQGSGYSQVYSISSSNNWSNGEYGNHWSDYSGSDKNNDYIGDTPYLFDGDPNTGDFRPLLLTPKSYLNPIFMKTSSSSTSTQNNSSFQTTSNYPDQSMNNLFIIILIAGGIFGLLNLLFAKKSIRESKREFKNYKEQFNPTRMQEDTPNLMKLSPKEKYGSKKISLSDSTFEKINQIIEENKIKK